MTDITVPPEALKAALNVMLNEGWSPPPSLLEDACLAMLQSWPRMARGYNDHGRQWEALTEFSSQPTDGYILPHTESSDDT
jgi:hypothetical protein